MNEQLIKFIELCLMDGVITDKEKEVIFRKSKELGVPEDECEIILESMTFKKNDNKKDSNNSEESIDETSQKEIKVNNEKDSKDNTNENQNQGKVTIRKKSDYGGSTQSQEEIKLQRFIIDYYDKGKVGEEEKKIIYEKSKELGVSKEICDGIMNTVSSIYDPESEPIKKEYEDGVEKNGLFIIKDEGEGRKWEQFYKDGLKHGLGKFCDENGKLSLETNYVMGKKDGLEKSYLDILGTHYLYSETQYQDGKKDGLEKIYSENGQLQSETYYKEGKITTEKKEFIDNEKKESEIIPKDIIKKNTNDITKSKTTEDIQHTHPSNEHTNINRNDKNKKSGKVDFSNFISVHSSKKGVFGRRFILDLEKTFKSINNKWYVEDKVREVIEPLKDKVIFKFSHSFVVGEDFLISVESGKKIPLLKVNDFELKDGKTISKSGFFLDDEWFGEFFSMDNEGGKELFYLFKKYINENLENDKSKNENNNQKSDNEKISNKDDGKVLEKDLILGDKKNIELKKQDFLKLITIENITDKKSKFYELLLGKDFYLEFEYFEETFILSLHNPFGLHLGFDDDDDDEVGWGTFSQSLRTYIKKIKLFVFINLFSDSDFFRLKRKKNIPYSVKDVFGRDLKIQFPISRQDFERRESSENHDSGKHYFGTYTDKNGFLFNPVTGYLVFYIDDNNIFNCDLGKVKSISTSPFLKGGMFSKSIIKLKQMSVCLKNGVKGYQSQDVSIEIKSKKLFKETETRYTNWIKFLFTLKDFENQLIGLRRKNLSNSNQELYEFLKGFSKVELNIYVKKVREVLNTKKDEIESKEKEFNSNFIQDFIKIINFVESNIENYWRMNISMCSQIDISIKKEKFLEYNEIEKITKSHNKFISLNSTIIFGLIEMIRSVIYNDRIRFYEIYEKFDKLRIFNSQYQNDVINSLSSINQNLVDLNSKIDNLTNTIEMMSDQILSSINELQFEVSYLNDNITGQLQSISSKLDVNNLLNMVQTYQLYRINSNTKSLRS